MEDRYQYRLSKDQKWKIAQNLIDFLEKDSILNAQTRRFINDWIYTGPEEKRKAFFDVWDIVLSNYLPTTRPILFRACDRNSKKEKIASFTGRLESARRFSQGRGFLIICDTKELLDLEEKFYKTGEYKHTFYPLGSALVKARKLGGCGFSKRLFNRYIGEDEYIMRTNLGNTHSLKWMKKDF